MQPLYCTRFVLNGRGGNRQEAHKKVDQLMNQLIFAFMLMGMSYRQAEDELLRRLKSKRFPKETNDN